MTQLSPTALEEAAKALDPDAWDSKAPGADDRREDARIMATAAITAYLAQMEKEGFVEVPNSALAWLFGEAPDSDGHWFEPPEIKEGECKRPYWWRSKLRAMLTAASQAWVPPFKVGDRVKHIGRNECGTVISTDDGVVDVEFDIQTPRGAISIGRFDERWFASHEGWLIATSQEQNDLLPSPPAQEG